MDTFCEITWIGLAVVVVGIWLHTIIASPRGKGPLWLKIRTIRLLFDSAGLLLPGKGRSIVGWLARLAAVVVVSSTVVLAITGFIPALRGERLSGYLLLIHVSVGPVLVVAATFWVLVRAARFTFGASDWYALKAAVLRDRWFGPSPTYPGPVAKVCFWALATLILPLGLSIVLSMFRIFDTETLIFMEEVHRYCALAFCGLGLIYAYLVARHRAFDVRSNDLEGKETCYGDDGTTKLSQIRKTEPC